MTFGENLISLRTLRGISRKDLAESLDIPYTTLRNYENDTREPGHKLLIKLATVLSVSVDELVGHTINNDKKAPPVSSEAMKLAKDYDDMDPHGKRIVRMVADEELMRIADERLQKTEETAEDNVIHIPFRCSTQSASAGTGTYLGPESFETIKVQKNDLTCRASFGVPVSGDSMEPTYHNGDILVVEAAETIEPGEIGIFSIAGEGYVKELGNGELISLNPEYDPIPMDDSIHCHGRVIGVLAPEWIKAE